MTYVSPIGVGQFVVISAGGNLVAKNRGDYVVACCRSIPVSDP
jgi:glucose dehydrogenase